MSKYLNPISWLTKGRTKKKKDEIRSSEERVKYWNDAIKQAEESKDDRYIKRVNQAAFIHLMYEAIKESGHAESLDQGAVNIYKTIAETVEIAMEIHMLALDDLKCRDIYVLLVDPLGK
jgi:hypothetical protein